METTPQDDMPADVPEADALEQAQSVGEESSDDRDERSSIPEDVPEADALEQSQEVHDTEEERR
jgi:hypothetical protein